MRIDHAGGARTSSVSGAVDAMDVSGGRFWATTCGRFDFDVGIRCEVRGFIEPIWPELLRRSNVDGWACVDRLVCGLIDRSRLRWWDADHVRCICRSVINCDHVECWKG